MKKFILAAALAAVVMVPFVLQRGTLNELRADKQRQQARIDELTEELRRASTNSIRTNAAGASGGLSRQQLHELMRLRAEVTALRQMTNAAAQQAAAPPPLPAMQDIQVPAPGALPEGTLTTNAPPWNNAGFSRPADTLSTMLWAMQQGRMDVVLSTATPEGQIQLQQDYGSSANPVEALQADGSKVVEVRPSTAFPSNENEVYMSMVVQESPPQPGAPGTPPEAQQQGVPPGRRAIPRVQRREEVVKLQKVGNDWRYAGTVR